MGILKIHKSIKGIKYIKVGDLNALEVIQGYILSSFREKVPLHIREVQIFCRFSLQFCLLSIAAPLLCLESDRVQGFPKNKIDIFIMNGSHHLMVQL